MRMRNNDESQFDQYDSTEKAKMYDHHKKGPVVELVDDYSAKKFLDDLTGKTAIDFACGTGRSTKLLADLNAKRVVGVDLSSEMISLAKRLCSQHSVYSKIEYYVNDCAKPMPEMGTFDVVYSCHLLNYAETEERLQSFVSSMYSILNENGICFGLMVNVHQDPSNFHKYGKYGFEYIRHKDNRQTSKLYEGDSKTGKLLFELINYIWKPELHESAFKIAGFRNFKWIEPVLDESIVDITAYFYDYIKYPPFIFFHATK